MSTATVSASVSATASASATTTATAAPAPLKLPGWVDLERPAIAETREQLLALLPPVAEKDEAFFTFHFEPGKAAKMNQGNPEIATHQISREQCWRGLQGVEIQTAEQKDRCGGHDYMVPIHPDGDPTKARFCIDQFEFPNRPCELPVVWSGATQAHQVCKKLGKRLCRQDEWMRACDGDPGGGEPRRYAYGDDLDLEICNTNKHAKDLNDPPCDARTVKSAWETCGTHTEPSGSFPQCRSRFGVYDQHGNVAEAMTRYDHEEGERVSQLKGSAFFYVDVHRRHDAPREKETYIDICRHDPRWHVQSMQKAWHVNYHLGFRCCFDIPPEKKKASK